MIDVDTQINAVRRTVGTRTIAAGTAQTQATAAAARTAAAYTGQAEPGGDA